MRDAVRRALRGDVVEAQWITRALAVSPERLDALARDAFGRGEGPEE